MKFTDLSLRSIPFAEGQRDYADDSFPGFSLRVGKRTKTFMVIVKNGEQRSLLCTLHIKRANRPRPSWSRRISSRLLGFGANLDGLHRGLSVRAGRVG